MGLAIVLLLLILFNGLFAMAEIAIISSRKSKLQQMVLKGKWGAKSALELAQNPDNLFSTIQIGITLIGVLAGAIGEATFADPLAKIINQIPIIGDYHEIISFLLIVGGITYISLILGELVPKRIAINNPENIAILVAPVMNALFKMTLPVVKLLNSSSEFVFRLIGLKSSPAPSITEDEIKILMGEGTRIGIFSTIEKKLVERVLHLDDLQLHSLMTPRRDIQWFDINKFSKDFKRYLTNYKHSRIIICDKTLDRLIGVAHVKDFLRHYLNNPDMDIRKCVEKPHLFPENTHTLKVLELFRKSPMHLALVIDEYGTVQGLVTFNDVLEALVGDIESRNWVEESKIIKRSNHSYLIDGMLSLEELKTKLKLESFPKEASGHITLGGFIISHLDKIPAEGDKFVWSGFKFEVVDMDGNRVDKVLVTPNQN